MDRNMRSGGNMRKTLMNAPTVINLSHTFTERFVLSHCPHVVAACPISSQRNNSGPHIYVHGSDVNTYIICNYFC